MPRRTPPPSGPNLLYPGLDGTDNAKVVRAVEDLYDKVNFLVTKVNDLVNRTQAGAELKKVEAEVAQLQVGIAAATDATTALSTFVGFGATQPTSASQSVIDGGATGYAFNLVGGMTTMVVALASQARSAIGAAQAGNPAGAPTTIGIGPITGGGTPGSITINASGVITAFVQPT